MNYKKNIETNILEYIKVENPEGAILLNGRWGGQEKLILLIKTF